MSKLSHFAAVFPVADPTASATWYKEKLSFEITFQWEEPATYVVTKREEAVSIHFVKNDGSYTPPANHNSLYIFCHDVDAVYDELKSNGATIHTPIETHDYGMRDFDIKDPDGFIVSFGQGVE